MKRSFSIAVLLTVCLYLPLSGALKDKVDAVTGGIHTRMVWLKGASERMTGGGDMWGFDSKTGVTQKLFNGSSNLFYRPIICSGGNKIVVTTIKDCKVYIYNWDGTGVRYLSRGVCSDVFKDPSTGKEYIVVHTRTDGSDWRRGDGVMKRYSIDDPSQVMTLFDKWTFKGEPWYQVTGDGKIGVGFLPWNQVYHVVNGGIATNGTHTALTTGCWTSATADNSHYWFHLDYVDGHDRIKMYRDKTLIQDNLMIFPGSVPVNTLETEMYHPKFASNGARYYVQTAGYTGNHGDPTAEVYFGKFAADYKTLGTCVRMTGDNIPDYWPDAWVGVEEIKELNLNETSLEFAASIGSSAPAAQTVTATAGGVLDISTISVSDNASWLTTTASGTGGSRTITNTIVIAGLTEGTKTATVTVTADGVSEQYTVTLSVTDPSTYHKKFDFGDSPVTGWESGDSYLTGGKNVASTATVATAGIANAAPAASYQTCRHTGVDFAYAVPNGTYTVRCHTVEWYYTTMAEALANRSMDITIEGTLVEDNMSPAGKAGALETAAVLEYPVTVSDGTLNLTVVNDGGNDAYLMGLEIVASTTGIADFGLPIAGFKTTASGRLFNLNGMMVDRRTAPAGIYLLNGPEGLRKIVISR